MTARICASLIALAAISLGPTPSLACSCLDPPTVAQALAASDVVFTGYVLDVRPYGTDGSHVVARLLADLWWKGAPDDTVEVVTGANDGVCGHDFVVPEYWLVYARSQSLGPGEPQHLASYLCGRTHEVYENDPDLAELGPPVAVPVRPASVGQLKVMYR